MRRAFDSAKWDKQHLIMEKAGEQRYATRIFNKTTFRCPFCKRGTLHSWDDGCKVCPAKIVGVRV